ncbi:unnamed protein product, partial [Nesidiocoris tenuis]
MTSLMFTCRYEIGDTRFHHFAVDKYYYSNNYATQSAYQYQQPVHPLIEPKSTDPTQKSTKFAGCQIHNGCWRAKPAGRTPL